MGSHITANRFAVPVLVGGTYPQGSHTYLALLHSPDSGGIVKRRDHLPKASRVLQLLCSVPRSTALQDTWRRTHRKALAVLVLVGDVHQEGHHGGVLAA